MNKVLIVWLCFTTVLLAQPNATLKGKILHADSTSAVAVTVGLKGTNYVSMTDSYGKFLFKVPPGEYIFFAQMIGMQTVEQKVELFDQHIVELPTILLQSLNKQLDEVAIEGKTEAQRLKEEPIKAEIIELKSIQQESSTLSEAMNRSAGIRIRQMGGMGSQASIFVNGFTGKAVKFFKDDIPIDYLGESFNITMLPINMLDRVEVYKGVMPAKLGADALGGAVNYVTKSNFKNYLDVSYEYASFNTHRGSVNLLKASDSSKVFYGFDGFINHSDNNYNINVKPIDKEKGTQSNEEVKVTRFNDKFTSGYGEIYGGIKKVAWADEFKIGFTAFRSYKGQLHDYEMKNPFGEVYSLQLGLIPTLRYKKTFLQDKLKIDQFIVYSFLNNRVVDTCSCAYDWFGNRTFVPSRSGEADANGSLSNVNFYNFTSRTYLSYQISKNIKLEFNSLLSNYTRSGSDPFGTKFFASNRDILSVPASYFKWISTVGTEVNFLRRFVNTIAIKRFQYQTNGVVGYFTSYDEDATQKSNHSFGFTEAVKFKINEYSFVRGSIEWANRLPEQGEIFGDGQFLLSNFDLNPERSTNVNIGYRYQKGSKFFIDPNFFYRITKDQIVLVPENLIYLQYQNVEQTRGYGIDLDLGYSPSKWLQMFGNMSYQELRLFGLSTISDRFLEDSRLRNTPYFFGNFGMRSQLDNVFIKNDIFRLFWYYSYTHEYYNKKIPVSQQAPNLWSKPTVAEDFLIPSQNVHTAGVTYSVKKDKVGFGFEVKNIFNVALFDNFRVQRAGRSFHIKLRYLIN